MIVVTYNSGQHLERLFESLRAADGPHRLRVITVDNNSSDDSIELARALGSEVVALAANRGFAAGVNAGIDAAGDVDAVLVLNPDTRLAADSVACLARELSRPDVGVVAPRLVSEGGDVQFSIRRDPSVRRAWAAALLGGTRAGRIGSLGEIDTVRSHYEAGRDIDWATGAALLVSAECLRVVGPWDESFFLYSEEVDFCQRARRAGFRVRYAPMAVVVHTQGDYDSPRLAGLLAVNAVRLFRRNRSLLATSTYYLALLAGCVLRSGRPSQRAAARALLSLPLHPEGAALPVGGSSPGPE